MMWSATAGAASRFLAMPSSPLGRYRRLLFLFGVFNIAVLVPILIREATSPVRLAAGLAAGIALATWWRHVYRRGGLGSWSLIVDAVLLIILTFPMRSIEAATGVFFMGLYFRAMYGTLSQALVVAAAYAIPYVAVRTIWSGLGVGYGQGAILVGLGVSAILMHTVAAANERSERAATRDRAMSRATAGLLVASDRASVEDVLHRAVEALVAEAPHLAACIAVRRGEALVVETRLGAPWAGRDAAALQLEAVEAFARATFRDHAESIDRGTARGLGLPDDTRFPHLRMAAIEEHRTVWGAIVIASSEALADGISHAMGSLAAQASLALEGLRLTEDLNRSEARFRSLVQKASEGVTVLDAEGTIVFATQAVERLLGYPVESLMGTPALSFAHPEDIDEAAEILGELLEYAGGSATVRLRCRHSSGEYIWVEATGTNLIDDPSVGGVVVNFRDVTEQERLHLKLVHQAAHDPLTDLANRSLFEERVEQELAARRRRGGATALVFVDLDGFKEINDTHGHATGDAVLVEVAARLQSCVRAEDTVARMGGDEFALLLSETGAWGAGVVARRILEVLRVPIALPDHRIQARASIGIAVAEEGSSASEELLRQADTTMYGAKERRSGYAVFTPPPEAGTIRRADRRRSARP